ncbi:MAG: peptidyl-prolyl cis-trans isomerase, partial [Gammaproteobacteria bacterium]
NISINQDDLQEIYNNNLSDYVNPEQVKVSYIELNPQKLEELIEISPEEINLEYQDYLNEFDSAIRKSVSHIMLNISDSRDLDAARKEIEVIKSRLTDGDSFESLVLELSEDEGTKNNQGSLGVTDGTLLPPEFEAALLTMDEGEYYGPIELLSSVHLIKLDEIIQPEPETLESKTQNIRENLISAKAEGMYIELLDRISNLTFSAEDIEQIGQEISQNVLSTEYLYEEELPDVLKGSSIKEYIFQEYGGDEYPELFETSQLSAVVLEVKGFNDEVQLSFDEVKSTIEDTYLNLETQKKVNNFLDDAITSLRADTTLEELSVSQKINIESYNKLKRDSSLFPLDVINTIFSLARSKAGEVYETAVLQNGDALIYRLDAVKEGSDGLNEETRQEFENLLSQQKTIAELSDLQQNLEENISIEILN